MAEYTYRVERSGRKWLAKELEAEKVVKVEVNDDWHLAIVDAGRMRRERRVSETIGFRA